MSVQSYGYNFRGTGVFHLFTFMHSFQKFVSDFADLEILCVRKDSHRERTTCRRVCEMNRGIHCKSGLSFMKVNARISTWNEEFCLSSLEMLILH